LKEKALGTLVKVRLRGPDGFGVRCTSNLSDEKESPQRGQQLSRAGVFSAGKGEGKILNQKAGAETPLKARGKRSVERSEGG